MLATVIRVTDIHFLSLSRGTRSGKAERNTGSASASIVILFKEAGAETRLSIRTPDGGVDATLLAGHWGGGGHARAAGATVPAPLMEATWMVLPIAEQLLQAPGAG